MRVLVDGNAAVHQGAGIGRYARNVLRAAVMADEETAWTIVWAGRGPGRFLAEVRAGLPDDGRVELVRIPIGEAWLTRLWHRAGVPLPIQRLVRRGADVVWTPDVAAPPAGRTPRVPTIHDLAFRVHPELYPEALRRYLERVTDRQVATAARIVTVSEASRADLVALAGADPDRVDVVPNGVDDRFLGAAPLGDADRTRLKLPVRYLLTVGTIEPRKNHLGLLAALDHIPVADRLPLVVAGRSGWGNDAIMAELRRREAAGQVVFLPELADDLLPGLYAGAAAMVYPARYEGFGIPVIEALATGIPTVVNDTPALVEAAGGHAFVVDASDPERLGDTIRRALRAADRSSVAGGERAAWASGHRWPSSGAKLVDILRKAVG